MALQCSETAAERARKASGRARIGTCTRPTPERRDCVVRDRRVRVSENKPQAHPSTTGAVFGMARAVSAFAPQGERGGAGRDGTTGQYGKEEGENGTMGGGCYHATSRGSIDRSCHACGARREPMAYSRGTRGVLYAQARQGESRWLNGILDGLGGCPLIESLPVVVQPPHGAHDLRIPSRSSHPHGITLRSAAVLCAAA